MQVVIDISEDYYKAITEIPNHQCTTDMLIIKNGTPLPKGHGRLIDADELVQEICVDIGMYVDEQAPTIIESDKGE